MATKTKSTLARGLAPEEIRHKQYVAVLTSVCEFLPDTCDLAAWTTVPLRRVEVLPWEDPQPMRVEAVCLPFVLVKSARGEYSTVDIRRHRLAELDQSFGDRVFRIFRKERKKATGNVQDGNPRQKKN